MTTIIEQILSDQSPRAARKVENQMRLAALIDIARTHKGWARKEFAEEMGCGASMVTRWLSGSHNFTIDTLSEIEVVLGISLLPKRKTQLKRIEFNFKATVQTRVAEPDFEYGEESLKTAIATS